jgi:hypothetical protein
MDANPSTGSGCELARMLYHGFGFISINSSKFYSSEFLVQFKFEVRFKMI